jgi:hypothetical protein
MLRRLLVLLVVAIMLMSNAAPAFADHTTLGTRELRCGKIK